MLKGKMSFSLVWCVLFTVLLTAGCEMNEIAANLESPEDSAGGNAVTTEVTSGMMTNTLELTFCDEFTVGDMDYPEHVIINSDGLGMTMPVGGGIESHSFESPELGRSWNTGTESVRPYVNDAASETIFATVENHSLDAEDISIAAFSYTNSDGDVVRWRYPVEARAQTERVNITQEIVMMPHPVGGVVVIGMLTDEILLGEGTAGEIRLENPHESAVNFMAHILVDGTLVFARVLNTDILPSKVMPIKEGADTSIILAGVNIDASCSPAALAKFDLSGNIIWETENLCDYEYDDLDDMEADPPVIFEGPEDTFYMVQGVYAAAVFKDTDGAVTVIPRMVRRWTETLIDGTEVEEYDAHSIVVARYNFDGKLLMAKRPDASLNQRTWGQASGVVYSAPFLLMGAKSQAGSTFDESKPIPFGLPPKDGDFLAAFDPFTLEALGTVSIEGATIDPHTLLSGGVSEQSVQMLSISERDEANQHTLRVRDLCDIAIVE